MKKKEENKLINNLALIQIKQLLYNKGGPFRIKWIS
jgi:hypothetical protein